MDVNHVSSIVRHAVCILSFCKCYIAFPILTLNTLFSSFVDNSAAARKHAVAFVQAIRTWNNRNFAKGLSRERPAQERMDILEMLYGRMVDIVAREPSERRYDIVEHLVTVAKEMEVRTMANGDGVNCA